MSERKRGDGNATAGAVGGATGDKGVTRELLSPRAAPATDGVALAKRVRTLLACAHSVPRSTLLKSGYKDVPVHGCGACGALGLLGEENSWVWVRAGYVETLGWEAFDGRAHGRRGGRRK
jgi:hypothetical protein